MGDTSVGPRAQSTRVRQAAVRLAPFATQACWRQGASGARASCQQRSSKPPGPRCPAGRSAPAPIGPGPYSSRAASTTVLTAAHAGEVTGPVRVTHPFHPLHGQELDVLAQRVQWGEGRVFYRGSQGHRASLPVGWTSLVAPDPYLTVGAARSRFRLQDLIDLAALLAGLRR